MTDYLNSKFDWNDAETVSAFDDISLWSSMAGKLLLEFVPMTGRNRVLDVGCGTGFPLLELAERIGSGGSVVGVDTSETALNRVRRKAEIRGVKNVEIVRADAASLPLAAGQFDLIVSNLGINNFADRRATLRECFRVAKPGCIVAMTTNLIGHMQEFYNVFRKTLNELELKSLIPRLETHTAHRAKVDEVQSLLRQVGFQPGPSRTVEVSLRYADGSAMLRHSLIRAGFLPAWMEIVKDQDVPAVFSRLEENLNQYCKSAGQLRVTVPIAYIEGRKP